MGGRGKELEAVGMSVIGGSVGTVVLGNRWGRGCLSTETRETSAPQQDKAPLVVCNSAIYFKNNK